MKGLICEVYSAKSSRDYSNGGISSRCHEVTIVGPGIPEIFEVTPERPAVRIVRRQLARGEYVHLEPLEPPPEGHTPYMAGGSFAYTCDSRFSKLVCQYPVSLHDRTDTWEDHERLSR